MASGLKRKSMRWAMASLLTLAAAGCSSGGGSDSNRTERHLPAKRVGSTGITSASNSGKAVQNTGKSILSSKTTALPKDLGERNKYFHNRGKEVAPSLKQALPTAAKVQSTGKAIANTGRSIARQAPSNTGGAKKLAKAPKPMLPVAKANNNDAGS